MKPSNYFLLLILSAILSISCSDKQVSQLADNDSISKIINSKDTISKNKISDEYSGVYKGKISVNTSPSGFELVDGWIAFDFTDNQNIVLYDGNFRDFYSFNINEIKGLGIFTENKNKKGFLMDFMEDDFEPEKKSTVFLEKKGDVAEAKKIIKKYKEEKELFEKFYPQFKQDLLNKDFKKVASYGKFPMVDASDGSKIYNSVQFEKKLKSVFDEEFFSKSYNIEALNNLPFRFEDHYPGNEGVYMLQTIIFINFKKIGDEIKIISISHPYN